VVRRNPVTRVRARVLAADDHAPFLAVLREVLSATNQLEVVGEAPSGEAAVEMAAALEPDAVLIDVRMPGLGGVEAAEQIKACRPRTLVVLISATHPSELPANVANSSADAVVWKSELEPRLLDDLWLRHRAAAG
jgi:two-component system invasion response regulator UvrY